MSFEKKRRNLRISLERKRRNPEIPLKNNTPSNTVAKRRESPKVTNPTNTHKKILSNVKSSNLGKNLYPDYIDKFKGESFIVAGCGESINELSDLRDFFVIGVNDIERVLVPDFLVVVNDYRTFTRGRWDWVRESTCPVIFSHLDNPGPITRKENLARITLGKRGTLDLLNKQNVDHTMNSPYMAAIIAYQMGARKIAIIGVDFTQNHFFNKSGNHKLNKHVKSINEEYKKLGEELIKKGVKIANLSSKSSIESWPKMSLDQFKSL